MRKTKNYWTKERCKKDALKYNNRTEYNKNSVSSYSKAWKKGWLDEICSHMEIKGNKYKRCIYVYEFDDNVAYIGLTYNMNVRHQQHMKRGPVYRHESKIKLYKYKQLTDYLNVKDVKFNENFYIKKYKNNGWKLLNSATGGATGGDGQKKNVL